MLLRAGVDQLDDAHAALDQAAGDQALIAKRLGVALGNAVRRERRLGFVASIECFGGLAHHAAGHVERGHPRAKICVAGPQGGVAEVHVAQHDCFQLAQRRRAAAAAPGRESAAGPGTIRTPW